MLRWIISLAALGLASARPATAQEAISTESQAELVAQEAIERLLETRVSHEFHDMLLSEILAALSQVTGVPMLLDERALENASIDVHAPLDCELESISLRAALARLLEPWELTWIIKDEVLLVTTAERLSQHLVVKVYPVNDLVGRRIDDAMSYEWLIETITDAIAPDSWDEAGGPGTIHEFRAAGALVIGQTQAIHADVAQLLIELRQTGRVFSPRSPADPPAANSWRPRAGSDAAGSGIGFF